MPSLYFGTLVELAAGAIANIPTTQQLAPDTLPALLAQSQLRELPLGSALPQLTLDEIEIDIPVHFYISRGQISSTSAKTSPAARLMTAMPSPLVPKSAVALSHFRMTLTLNSDSPASSSS
ncbi:MAG: hypothetical protein ICV62_12275 [Cyanobacteria bacterium Co-bin13]|nr:hypothetical protein [Cyanobacteria bacterium Co-bin13]